MSDEFSDDLRLIRRALRGDRRAAKRLVQRLMPVVRARVRSVAGLDAADDIVQEVWRALFEDQGKKLMAFDPERGKTLEGFVGLIARHETLQVRRRQGAQKRGGHLRRVLPTGDESGPDVPARDPGPSPESLAATTNLVHRLGEHLTASLPEMGRLVFRYVYTDGLEPSAVAQILGVNVQVVYNWQHKVRAHARTFLAKTDECAS